MRLKKRIVAFQTSEMAHGFFFTKKKGAPKRARFFFFWGGGVFNKKKRAPKRARFFFFCNRTFWTGSYMSSLMDGIPSPTATWVIAKCLYLVALRYIHHLSGLGKTTAASCFPRNILPKKTGVRR